VTFRVSGIWLGAVAPFLLLQPACGGEETGATACPAGRSIACTGAEGCAGHQICRDDGSGYDFCVCAGDEMFPSAGPNSGLLGATCVDDSDCRAGTSCLTTASTGVSGEGPSAGLCVVECARDASICEEHDPGTTCAVLDDRGTSEPRDDAAFCLPTCEVGDPDANEDKCRGRIDLVCDEDIAGTGVGYCRPACRSDVDCDGRQCNLRTGFCADELPGGDPIGSACDPEAPECAGGCIDHGSSYAECSGVCRLGTPGCGQTTSDGPPYDYYCYLDPSNQGGQGDLGYCVKLCDCNDDCERADAVCEPRSSLSEDTERRGVCASATFASGEKRPSLPCN